MTSLFRWIATVAVLLHVVNAVNLPIAIGCHHFCVLDEANVVYCWGDNSYSQCGYSTAAVSFVPDEATSRMLGGYPVHDSVKNIVAGCAYTCVEYMNDTMECFGHTPTVDERPLTPMNAMHTTLAQDFELYLCESNNITADPMSFGVAPTKQSGAELFCVANFLAPVRDIPVLPVDITAGVQHSCVLFSNGKATCWGGNTRGQAGMSPNKTSVSVAEVDFLPMGGPLRQIQAGHYHTCAVYVNGSVKCWGWNDFHQLGLNRTAVSIPLSEVGLVDTGAGVASVHPGYRHTCFRYHSGFVKCVGRSVLNQLGYNNTDVVTSPLQVGYVPAGGRILQLSGRGWHTCGIYADDIVKNVTGGVKCWGNSNFGQTGQNSTVNVAAAADMDYIPLLAPAIQIAANGFYHTCALYANGSAHCFGSNRYGECGVVTDSSTILSPRQAGVVEAGGRLKHVTLGSLHTCGVYEDDTLRCWGFNGSGELGQNHTDQITIPANISAIPLPCPIRKVAAGDGFTCVLCDAGMLCWGLNTVGQLGQPHLDPATLVLTPANLSFINLDQIGRSPK